ncbi:MAG: hypothetical protein PVG66_02595 [Chromatiales bacterium]|jgi:hypothetical protein
MELHYAQELLDCLPKERSLYGYCRDRYAAQLLQLATQRYSSIRDIKTSGFGKLLDRPGIKQLIHNCGNGRIDPDLFSQYWLEPGVTYLVTAGLWGSKSGRYTQTSRPGYNLVLHLNFNHQHDHILSTSIKPKRDGVFNYGGHPQLRRGERHYYRETLAWARLDVDLDNDEVLVEEIQSDWVRDVARLQRRLTYYKDNDANILSCRYDTTVKQAKAYLQFVEPLLKDWSQAMLSAVIDFVRHELGIDRLWYHSWETGNCLKRINREYGPPRSLYTRLPRQFCFDETDSMPGFLNNKRTHKRLRRAKLAPHFYQLTLQ